MERIQKVKETIKKHYDDACCGCYFTRNFAGDSMETIYAHDGVIIDICRFYRYFEIFGLTEDEQAEVLAFYEECRKEWEKRIGE